MASGDAADTEQVALWAVKTTDFAFLRHNRRGIWGKFMTNAAAQGKILHICPQDKFIPPFIEFIKDNFEFERHTFLITGNNRKFPVQSGKNVILIKRRTQLFTVLREMNQARKIILHGIFSPKIVLLLAVQLWLLKKCYWVMWGGDLYYHQFRSRGFKSNLYEANRAFVIKRIGNFVTYIKGDYELAHQWYGANGQYHECLMYPSNLYTEYVIPQKNGAAVNILVGNSATPTNNHLEILEKLCACKSENVMIYCPLSYGDCDYAKKVAQKGAELFGDRFVALMEFIPFENYLKLLGQIDIAVFAHNRQQAMGNTITLLGLGKKVYMRNNVTPWPLFTNLGVCIFDVDQLDLSPLAEDKAKRNKEIIYSYFSEKKLIEQYSKIFR